MSDQHEPTEELPVGITKKVLMFGAAAAATVALGVGPASAGGNGAMAKDCLGSNFGKSGAQYGQFKKTPVGEAHGFTSGYGLPQLLAAHCSMPPT
jgi:hypothetical protein